MWDLLRLIILWLYPSIIKVFRLEMKLSKESENSLWDDTIDLNVGLLLRPGHYSDSYYVRGSQEVTGWTMPVRVSGFWKCLVGGDHVAADDLNGNKNNNTIG